MTHISTQTQLSNFLQRAGAMQSQIGYSWVKSRDEGAKDAALLYAQYEYLDFAINALCPFVIGATDNLLTDEEADIAYEQITAIGNICDTRYLLNDIIN
jgi:hypothetical protein